MPNYTDVRVDAYLTKFARDYLYNEPSDFVVNKLCPRKKVASTSYKYKYYGKEILRQDVNDIKAPKGQSSQVGFDIFTGSGTIKRRSLESDIISDDEIREAPSGVDVMEKYTRFLTAQLMLQQEQRMVTLMEATTYTAAAGNTWSHASGDILTNLRTLKAGMFTNAGRYPTHIAASAKAWEGASGSAVLQGQVKYQEDLSVVTLDGPGLAASKPAGLIGVVSGALKDTAIKGATESISPIFGNDAYAVLVDPADEALTWAIQPMFEDYRVYKWREEREGGWRIKVTHAIDLKEVCAAGLHALTDVSS